jgi:hypothetical protein
MKVYDNYEISQCRRFDEPDPPGRFYFEVCEPHEADIWTLYGHIEGEGVQAIADFSSRDAAEQLYFRITGQSFSGSYRTDARLRVMNAGPRLLDVLRVLLRQIDEDIPTDITSKHFASAYDDAQEVVLDLLATGMILRSPQDYHHL